MSYVPPPINITPAVQQILGFTLLPPLFPEKLVHYFFEIFIIGKPLIGLSNCQIVHLTLFSFQILHNWNFLSDILANYMDYLVSCLFFLKKSNIKTKLAPSFFFLQNFQENDGVLY